MANHKSSKKRIRSSEAKKIRNRRTKSSLKNSLKAFNTLSSKEEAQKMLPSLFSKLDKMAKKNVIHKNKSNNIKSKLSRQVNSI